VREFIQLIYFSPPALQAFMAENLVARDIRGDGLQVAGPAHLTHVA
jgi:hypothetical protein